LLWLRLAVGFRKIAASHDLRAEQPEEVRRDRSDANLLRRAVLTRHDSAARVNGGDAESESDNSVKAGFFNNIRAP
jgi:hypothetical protein